MFGVSGYGHSGHNSYNSNWTNSSYEFTTDIAGNPSEPFYGLIGDENELTGPTNVNYVDTSSLNGSKFEELSSCAFSNHVSASPFDSTTQLISPVDEHYHPLVTNGSTSLHYAASPSDETTCSSPQSELGWSDLFAYPHNHQPPSTQPSRSVTQTHAPNHAQQPHNSHSSQPQLAQLTATHHHPHAPQPAMSNHHHLSTLSSPSCELFASEALKAQAAQLNAPTELPRHGWTKLAPGPSSSHKVVKENLRASLTGRSSSTRSMTNLSDQIIDDALIRSDGLSPEDEERKRRRRERNKVAATKCRHKKKAHVLKLGVESELLTSSNEALRRELLELQAESERLAELLAQHRPYCRNHDSNNNQTNYV